MSVFNEIHFNNLRGDLFGGVTAAVIALPMALAFGVASGAGPAAGLYGAMLVGLFAALFGSTPTLISEPTGPMTVVMTAVIAALIAANPEQGMAMAFTVVMMAGFFQIIFGLLRLGHYVTMMPYTVVSGFMTGIGVILIILQLAPFLGQPVPAGGVIGVIESVPDLIRNIQPAETGLALLTFAILLFFPNRWRRHLPPQLLALIVGSLISVFLLSELDIRRIGQIPTGLPELQLPVFDADQWKVMFVDALVLAVLGSIDALLTSVIAENLTRKESDANKELFGQGLGNLAAGLFGGIPGAGATMGTVVNIQSGGRTILSGITRVLLLLVVVLWAADLTAQIPLAVLAGIALKVGFDIIDWSFIKRAHRVSRRAAFIMYGVIGLTVFVDLIAAVAIGVFIANFLTIERITRVQGESLRTIDRPDPNSNLNRDECQLLQQAQGKVLIFSLRGALIFGLAKVISRRYAVLDAHELLVLDFTEVPELGVSSSLALEEMILSDLRAGLPVFVVGASEQVLSRLGNLGVIEKIGADRVWANREEALKAVNRYLTTQSDANSKEPKLPA